ncbi:MAG: DUF1349 domain-containing protein [Erysipelotrichaceae bacterium]|nr:DUF1349 domain-containing protein [Erysipelotrichaceae bacterium]
MKVDLSKFEWTREPKNNVVSDDKVEIITEPFTDLWQRTYYHFRNDNAPALQMKSEEEFFSFTVKAVFESKHRFDQGGVIMYLDSENWIKASVEYENEEIGRLGSVVTNNGYSDWATTDIDASVKCMWFRLSRRQDDFCLENSSDGKNYKQMRICHMFNVKKEVTFGIYACSPEDSSFKATFSEFDLGECKWLAHDGQKPDEE